MKFRLHIGSEDNPMIVIDDKNWWSWLIAFALFVGYTYLVAKYFK